MKSAADPSGRRGSAQFALLDGLRRRLETAEELTLAMRAGLASADEAAIELAASRLETLALEYKVLAGELARAREQRSLVVDPDERVGAAMTALEETATRIARSSAIAGGLLERMVAMSRGLLDALNPVSGAGYLPSGRSTDYDSRGLRLREQA